MIDILGNRQFVAAGFHAGLTTEFLGAILIYAAGFATNELFDRLNQKRTIRTLTQRTEVAFKAIELAEKKYPGPHRGPDKLRFASQYLLMHSRIKKFKEAQDLILKCFPLTTLAQR